MSSPAHAHKVDNCCHVDPDHSQGHLHGSGGHQVQPQSYFSFKRLLPIVLSFILAGISMVTGMKDLPWVAAAASILVVVIFGRSFLRDILRLFGAANMNTLVGIGIVSSWGLSLWHMSQGDFDRLYFDSAAFIAAFVLLGQWMEGWVRFKMYERIGTFRSLIPTMAHQVSGEGYRDVALGEIQVGDSVRVLVGERVPVDATLISKDATLDLSIVTGESKPVFYKLNASVPQGALNVGQPIDLKVSAVATKSLYEQIVNEVQSTLAAKPPLQKKVDRIARWFVPLVVVFAGGVAVFWKQFSPGTDTFITTSIAILVVACPCAIGIATPTAFMVGIFRAARRGILVKSMDAIEKVSDLTTIAFDKTGTLTEGHPKVQRMKAVENFSHSELVQLALSVERDSEHPYAHAIRERAKEENISALPIKDLRVEGGKGVAATVTRDGKNFEVVLGNLVWLFENDYDSTQIPEALQWEAEGGSETALWLGVDKNIKGILLLADPLRTRAREVVQELMDEGFEVGMITGDAENVARAIARELKLSFYHAGVIPAEKGTLVKRMKEPKKKGLDMVTKQVCFVGDGVNDAIALSEAHLGIALASGASISQAASEVVLAKSDVSEVANTIKILRSTRSLVRQNLWISFGYNIIAIPIAAGALLPYAGWTLTPTVAAVAMSASSVTVLLNSLRHLKN